MGGIRFESGYTRVANELLEEVCKLKLNGTQFRIIMIVWRYTYGFQRKEHKLSLTFISKATGINKMQIQREIAKLINDNIIIVSSDAGFNKSRTIAFNDNYKMWLNSEQLTKQLTPNELVNETVSELVNETVSELDNQEIKVLKENIKEINKPPQKPKKQKYGEYGNASLSDNEKEKLITELGEEITEKCIKYLDEYVEMKGYKHKSSYLAIKKWVVNAVKEEEQKENKQKGEDKTYGEKYGKTGYDTTEFYKQFYTE